MLFFCFLLKTMKMLKQLWCFSLHQYNEDRHTNSKLKMQTTVGNCLQMKKIEEHFTNSFDRKNQDS